MTQRPGFCWPRQQWSMFAYDARTGQHGAGSLPWTGVENDPQVQDGVVYVTSQNGTLYAIERRLAGS